MKKIMFCYILTAAVYGHCFSQITVNPATTKLSPVNGGQTKKILAGNKSMTTFNPAIHSFKFANTFQGVDVSTRYGGLCGGMVYSALDYFYARVQIPQQTYAPANRYPLHSYIYKRQAKSAQESNWDRWAELWFNPGGARSTEFFNWGIEIKRMNELKKIIDAGKPVPIGLYENEDAEKFGYNKCGKHQVLAIGYDFGKYKGDKGDNLSDFKIYVYDPNYPGVIRTLVADVNARCFHYLERYGGKQDAWLTYFVDSKYEPFPPLIMDPPNTNTTLCVAITTGEDDLRGGNDNLAIQVNYADGSFQKFENVNKSAVWVSDYKEVVPLNLNRIISNKSQIRSIKFSCSFGGGMGGDNWDFCKITISKMDQSSIYLDRAGTFNRNGRLLIKRFTGSDKELTLNVE